MTYDGPDRRRTRATLMANLNAARLAHQATIDACVANYSKAAWDAIEVTEIASRNALAELEAADKEMWANHAVR